MPDDRFENVSFDLAAGGVLQRDGPRGREIIVVHRSRYDDWVLPKGHPEAGEDWESAALREIREETGYSVRIIDVAEPVAYMADDTPKLVLFYLCEPVGEQVFRADDEVREAVWVPVPKAIKTLSYSTDRELVRRLFAREMRTRRRWWERLRPVLARRRDPRSERAEAVNRIEQVRLAADSDCAATARALLMEAECLVHDGRLGAAWRLITAAERELVRCKTPEELVSHVTTLREDATDKLSGWRKRSLLALLERAQCNLDQLIAACPPCKTEKEITAEREAELLAGARSWVEAAQKVADEHFANRYMKLDVLQQNITRVTVFFLLVAFGLLGLVAAKAVPDGAPSVLLHWEDLLLFAALGALGATLSAQISAVGAEGRIPDVLTTAAAQASRPLVGAAAAITVVVVVQSGVLGDLIDFSTDSEYVLALAAGFSERLYTRVLNSVSKD